ncbi:hypothetical protein GMOD_00006357 [Pyrenophora seminiperda CCB06]|uniref:Uncharacterized protein n=1 Tax=Pyrenophora seminiperda CCB06 TaxID=1302712 RepID=A0A3M7M571_9PLEO|nr:hypothetical protein GMOD_00006357 [Pyrenophora seminiperda CCB06]
MRYLATVIGFTMALAPGSFAQDVACCLEPPYVPVGSNVAACKQPGARVACELMEIRPTTVLARVVDSFAAPMATDSAKLNEPDRDFFRARNGTI